jgi:hypothetical protein
MFALVPEERRIIAVTLGLKVLLLLLGIFVSELYLDTKVREVKPLFDVWQRWDVNTYLRIADHGYQEKGEDRTDLAFFPLFPMLIRAVMATGLTPIISSMVVSAFSSLFAGVLLYRLARLDNRPRAAGRAAWFFLIFPTAYFLHLGMTEATFMALALGAFLAARRRRWLLAGSLGLLAAATRMNGALLLPALALEAWAEWRETRKLSPSWIFLGMIAFGTGLYLILNVRVTGNPFGFMTMQKEHWAHSLAYPWVGMWNALQNSRWFNSSDGHMVGLQEFFYTGLGLVATVVCAVRLRRPSYTIWMFSNWLLFASLDFLISNPRYTLSLFPLFLLMGQISAKRTVFLMLTCWCLLFYAVFATLFAQGRWAF